MSTLSITKIVKRKTVGRARGYGKGARPIIVSFLPGDVLGFRLMRSRKTYLLDIAAAMDVAIKLEVARMRDEKRAAKKKNG